MIADRVHETTTITGTGDLTTLGAETGKVTFNSCFGTNNRFPYLLDDEAGAWEIGIGYLSGATTLVREQILHSSNADALVNFSAGTKQVGVAMIADCSLQGAHKIATDLGASHVPWVFSQAADAKGGSTSSLTANRIFYHEFNLEVGAMFSGIAQYLNTASAAGTEAIFGIYDVGSDGRPGNLLTDNNMIIDCASTGEKTSSFAANIYLSPGRYYGAAVVESASAVMRGMGRANMSGSVLLGIQPANGRAIAAIDEAYLGGWVTPVLPAAAGAGAYSVNTYESLPLVLLVPA